METVKEIFQSIYDSYRDRIKSPLVGSFIITYLIFNWRLVAILFYSEWPIHCRIEWIEENYCEWYHYVVPFLIALFYVMGLPYLNLGFEKILEKYSTTKLTKKNNSKLDALDHKKKEAEKKRLIADAEAGTSEIINLNEKIKNLNDEIEMINTINKSEIERYKTNDERNQQIIKEQISTIKQQIAEEKEYKAAVATVKEDLTKKIMPLKIKKIIENLSDIEKVSYVQYVTGKTNGKPHILTHGHAKKFKILEIIEEDNDGKYYLTDIGLIVYHFMTVEL